MQFPADRLYSREHEWILVEGEEGIVGITDFAQDQLGDIVFVELPELGAKLAQDAAFAVVESVKSVSDVFAPVGGEVIARNERLLDEPELLNDSPYREGWIARIRIAAPGELESLLDAAAYQEELGTEPTDG